MNKNAIKKYAVWARRELISRVSQRATFYGITETDTGDANAVIVNGRVLSEVEKRQRQALIYRIRSKGYEQVMEEVAYTWFNRFSALRFMEVNGYLPSHVRVFTDDDDAFNPQILTEAINLNIDGIDMKKVYDLKTATDNNELFKYLIIVQCNALSDILPGMFQHIEDYTELLFPDNLLRAGSVVEQMITLIPQENWQNAVQILGWLYQYYNTEPKAKVFDLPKGAKYKKEDISVATQLFTPDWIVRYMVENSLGRLWLEGHPNKELRADWKYYVDEAEQTPKVKAELDKIREGYKNISPEEIKVIDPCMGSGHILVYVFDVLMQIYKSYGYTTRDAVRSILQNNIYGLDIDTRAYQLAYFAVMMKARQYDRRLFSRGFQPNVYAITESNNFSNDALEYFCNGNEKLTTSIKTLVNEFYDAKEYGAILDISPVDFKAIYTRIDEVKQDVSIYNDFILTKLLPFVQCAEVMTQTYHAVITNPPYMGSKRMNAKLSEFVKKQYKDSKSDMFAVFIEKCLKMTKQCFFTSMVTMQSWMFLTSFEKLRVKLMQNTIIDMVHLGARAFEEIGGEVVQSTAFVISKNTIVDYKGAYYRLIDGASEHEKEKLFLANENCYTACQANFAQVPGSTVAYWASEALLNAFEQTLLNDKITAVKGLDTCDNDRFTRFWYELSFINIGFNKTDTTDTYTHKWYPYCKGGGYSKWYGFITKVVDWENDGVVLRHLRDKRGKIKSRPQNIRYYFKEGLTWSSITSGKLSLRYMNNCIFGGGGSAIFANEYLYYYLAFINSHITNYILQLLNPTLNFLVGDMLKLPIIIDDNQIDRIKTLAKQNIDLSKADWDSFETSWDFKRHPLIKDVSTVSEAYLLWEKECNERFQTLKANEEQLNRIFIDIYGLQDELTPDVEDKAVTVRKADLQRDIKSLISYAIGCMFGRYSLDCEGLAFAGGEWDATKYNTVVADKDNIIPICDDEYFSDDIVGRFIDFIKIVYGNATLEDNLKFIADTLGGTGTPREVIRKYFLTDFYKDHCKIYQKRPIYWLFDSGKKNGFKCLSYMHRYQSDTIARIRTDYVHEQQSRYRTAIADLQNRIEHAETGEKIKLKKKLGVLQNQAEEIRIYEEKIHHLADQMIKIDLDDGVKKNYAIFKDVLAKIK